MNELTYESESIATVEPCNFDVPNQMTSYFVDEEDNENGIYEVEYYMRRFNNLYFRNGSLKIKTTVRDDVMEQWAKDHPHYHEKMVIKYEPN